MTQETDVGWPTCHEPGCTGIQLEAARALIRDGTNLTPSSSSNCSPHAERTLAGHLAPRLVERVFDITLVIRDGWDHAIER